MNHDDEDELFLRLEDDMATGAGEGGDVVDLAKARSLRGRPEPASGQTPVLVDSPNTSGPGLWDAMRSARRRPVIPRWARSVTELRASARWVVGYLAHTAVFHLVRCPLYAARLAGRTPRGAVRIIGRLLRWATDAEGASVRAAAVRAEDARVYLTLSRQRDDRVRLRTWILGLTSLLGTVLVVTVLLLAPEWMCWTLGCSLMATLGIVGTPADRPLISRAVVAPQVQRLTSEVVIRALGALGVAEINKALAKGGGGITFPAPITRDGPGWRADVDLPYGVTVTDIIERRDRLASGLRRPLGCVWPEPAHDEHEGRLVLWVGDQDMNKVRAPAWPLARSGSASLFTPVPFATDQRGRTVSVPLMFANVLIGAMPRVGKTFALRVLLLAAALDVTAELLVWELKGTGDLEALAKVAADYGSGPDDATIEAALASLHYVHGELERRAKVLRGLPKDLCPENKVTPELARKKSLGLHPLVVAVDECQELFSHPEYGKEAGDLATAIIKRGPAMGVILLLATQRPDRDSLPTGVSANVGIRFCLRVMGQVENDMVLGTSAYRNGIRATTFTARDMGIGYLVGAGPDAQIARSFYVDAPGAERICARARAARIAAGTLGGQAAGQAPQRGGGADTLLDDLLAVIPASEAKVWSETATARLAELRPEVYGGWGPEQLAVALKPHGITTGQVWSSTADGKGANRRGIIRAQIADAITQRNRKRETG